MSLKIAFQMDPIQSVNIDADSTFRIAEEAQARASEAAAATLRGLFAVCLASPERLPEKYADVAAAEGPARAVGDYLSSLTDRSALQRQTSQSA